MLNCSKKLTGQGRWI